MTVDQEAGSSDNELAPAQDRRKPPGWLLPVAAGVAVVAATYAWNPELIRSTLSTPRALVFIAVVVAVVAGVGRLLGPRRPLLARGIQLALVVVVLALTVVPTIRNIEVDEELDVLASGSGSSAAPSDAGPESREPSRSTAIVLAEGSLRKLDYRASGQARLIKKPDGTHVVRLENLDVQPGPDYVVYLVPADNAERPSGGVSLGKLKGNKGNQNYQVPEQVKLGEELTVLIWCRAFAAPVGNAVLT